MGPKECTRNVDFDFPAPVGGNGVKIIKFLKILIEQKTISRTSE